MRTRKTLLGIGAGIGIGLGIVALTASEASGASASYAWMRRLFIKAGDAAADATVRQAINSGAPHEEYELRSPEYSYWDMFWGTFRGERMPDQYRSMWRDPLSLTAYYETYTNMVLQHRHPFYHVMHNAKFDCASGGDSSNAYDFGIRARATYLIQDRVVKTAVGHEVLLHPVNYQFGLVSRPVSCVGDQGRASFTEIGSATVARGGAIHRSPVSQSADIDYIVATYDIPL
ncbi:MAG: hypothetical protein AB7J34_24595 [Limisphaerales bacterium]